MTTLVITFIAVAGWSAAVVFLVLWLLARGDLKHERATVTFLSGQVSTKAKELEEIHRNK